MKEQPDPQHSQRWRLKHPVDWLWCIYPRGGFFFLFFCFVLRFSPGCKCHRKDDGADAVPPVTENKLAGLHFFFFLLSVFIPHAFRTPVSFGKCHATFSSVFGACTETEPPKEGWNFGFTVRQLRNCRADTCSYSTLHCGHPRQEKLIITSLNTWKKPSLKQ